MSIPYSMIYGIQIQDDALYQLALAMSNGTGQLALPPRTAYEALGGVMPFPSGDVSQFPLSISFYDVYFPGAQIGFPGPSGVFLSDSIETYNVPAQPGVPASIWPADPTKNGVFSWVGFIQHAAAVGASTNPPVALSNIPQRRHMAGREMTDNNTALMEGGSLTNNSQLSRDSSRTPDGLGWCMRGGTGTNVWSRTPTQFRAIGDATRMWDRFYFRVRRLPSQATPVGIWNFLTLPSSSVGNSLKVTQGGALNLFSIDGGGTETFKAQIIGSIVIDQWYKVDILVKTDTTFPGVGFCNVWINGVSIATAGLGGQATSIQQFRIGKYNSLTDNEFEVDFDDWINADWPANFTFITIANQSSLQDSGNYSIDWLNGSHVRPQHSVSITQVNWNPAASGPGIVNQEPSPEDRINTSEMTSTTSGATLEGLTDAPTKTQLADLTVEVNIGAAAAVVDAHTKSSSAGETTGQLGYRIAGGAAVLTPINEGLGEVGNNVAYLPTLGTFPSEISPFSVDKTKSTNANTNTLSVLMSAVEYIGAWGPEDSPQFVFPNGIKRNNNHNGRYFGSQYIGIGARQTAPVYAVGGTYTGNGTYQEIVLPGPCHFLKIRDVAGIGTKGPFTLGSNNNFHNGSECQPLPNLRLFYDVTNHQYKFSVTGGAGNGYNVSATVYQYIAFCDPGLRYCLGGAFSHANLSSTPKVNAMCDASFLPDCAFFQQEDYLNDTGNGGYFKGPANPSNVITMMDGSGTDVNGCNFTPGIINSFQRLHSAFTGAPNYGYLLWRMSDSGIDPNTVMIQVLSYTGNGTNPRTINLTPVSNRFPLFVLIVPNSGTQSFYRDPSHAGANSCNWQSSTAVANAITAVAKDQITINTAVNVNGVAYNVFVIVGDSAGMNNGTFSPPYGLGANANYQDGQFNNGVNILGNGGLVLDGVSGLGLLKNVSGVYQLTIGARTDTLQDTQTGQPSSNQAIPNPFYKTGFIGG